MGKATGGRQRESDDAILLRGYRAMIEVAMRFIPLGSKETARRTMEAVAMGEVHSDAKTNTAVQRRSA